MPLGSMQNARERQQAIRCEIKFLELPSENSRHDFTTQIGQRASKMDNFHR